MNRKILMPHLSFNRKVLLLILASAILRIIIGAAVELGNDEVYYWTYSQHLQWNYFDHPPMVAVWIRAFTLNLLLQNNELFIRLGSIFSCAIATWLIYRTTALLHSEKAGCFAACLYNASVYASIIAGLFILPDSPQMIFWTANLYLIARIIRNDKSWVLWLLLGVCTGLCIMSKVHGVFIWLGIGLYTIFRSRQWLLLPQLYVAVVIALLICSPILWWNMQNHFATYNYHSQRVTVHSLSLNTDGFLRELIGQVLYNNPINFVLILLALLAVHKRQIETSAALTLYNYIAIPMAVLLLTISLFRDTLPHWSGPAYVSLLPVAAIRLSMKSTQRFPAVLQWSLGLVCFALVGGAALINYFPGTIGSKDQANLGSGDFTLDMQGWRQAGEQFKKIYNSQIQLHQITSHTPLIGHKWFPAAHEDYYLCRPLGLDMIGLGNMEDLHHYLWSNEYKKKDTVYANAICIVPSNESYNVRGAYESFFSSIDSVAAFDGYRANHITRHFYIYLLRGWKRQPPLPADFWATNSHNNTFR